MDMDKNQQRHHDEAKKLLTALDTMPCNVEGSGVDWKSIIEYRKQAVKEYIKYLETGKTDHININITPPRHEHFK